MRILHLTACAAVLLTALAPRITTPAETPLAKLKTTTVFIKYEGNAHPGIPVELVQLPPGNVLIKDASGKEREHEVKPIWMARYETRVEQYTPFFAALDLPEETRRRNRSEWQAERTVPPYHVPGRAPAGNDGDLPVGNATLAAAKKYCAWLSKNTGKKFRLPTEAEWEYACRAGGGPVKMDPVALGEVAWFAGNVGGPQVTAPLSDPHDPSVNDRRHPVGKKQPNAWGLYDMLGNVGEYVIRDPKDDKGVIAGGSYLNAANDVHCEAREPYSPAWRKYDPQDPLDPDWLWYMYHVGFRVVMEE